MQTSASLNTHSIWQNAIGYDPYAAESSGADTGASAEAAASARDKYEKATTEVKAENVRLRRYLGAHGTSGFGVAQGVQGMVREAEARQQEAEAEYRHAEAALLRARRKREQYARPFQV